MNKKICICFVLVLVFVLITGCSNSQENTSGIYTVKSERAKFQGKLVSRNIEQYDYDPSIYELRVTNGQEVSAGTVLFSLSDNGKESLSSSIEDEYDINVTQNAKLIASNELNSIKKGDYSASVDLLSDYSSLKEQLVENQNEIKAQEIVIETARITYEYEVAALKKDIESMNEGTSVMEATDVIDEVQPHEPSEELVDSAKILSEIEKITKLYEKEQETNNLQLNKLKNQRSQIKAKISDFSSSLTVQNRIKELEKEISGYEQIEQKYNQKLKALSSDYVVANCDGLVEIDKTNLYVYSNTIDFRFTTSTQNLQKFCDSDTKYNLQYNNEMVGTVELSYYLPSQTEDMYDLIYTISCSKEVKFFTNTYAYMVSEEEIFIPADYIFADDNGDFYVQKNREKVKIEASLVDGQYKLISGLNVGDKIEKFD